MLTFFKPFSKFYLKLNHHYPSFTLIETLVSIGISISIALIGTGLYINNQKAKLLNETVQQLVYYLKYAQQKAISQENNYQWGVHLENPSAGNDFYALFQGSTYSSAKEMNYLPSGIEFVNPSTGNSIDIVFNKLTGFLSYTNPINITLKNSANITANIIICPQGLITYNNNNTVCGSIGILGDSTPPTIGTLTPSNYTYGSYVSSPFTLSATATDYESSVTSCEYTINGGTNWYSATLSGSSPTWTCTASNIVASDGTNLSLNIRATSSGGIGIGSAISKTVDAASPTASDNWTDNWTASSSVSLIITPSDGSGSGINVTKYCVDTTNTCTPATIGTSVSVSCASDSTCTQYVRYATWDNVNNASSIYSKRVRQDLQAPVNGTLTATAGDTQVTLSWSGFSDSGSGLAASNTYKLVYQTGSTPTSCSVGTQIYLGTAASYIHTGLTNGTTYYYRLCAYDAVGNVSTGSTASATPTTTTTTTAPPTCTCTAWSDCSSCSYSSTCATTGTGTQTRTCTPAGCSTESQSCTCTRSTDGVICSSWSTCSGSYSSTCDTTCEGTQTASICSGGSCTGSIQQSCSCGTRSTDGTYCGTSCSTCGYCSYSTTCATSGTGTQECLDSHCSGGSCLQDDTLYAYNLSCTCTRSTDGVSCGTNSCCYSGSCLTPCPI